MLQIPLFRTPITFLYRAVKNWNDVVANLKQAPSLYTFKKMYVKRHDKSIIKQHIIDLGFSKK